MIYASVSASFPLVCSIFVCIYCAETGKSCSCSPFLASFLSATPEISAYLLRSSSFSCSWSKRVIWVSVCSLIWAVGRRALRCGCPKRRRFWDALFLKMEDSYADSFLVIWVAEKMLENQRNSNVLFFLFAFFSTTKQRVLVSRSGFAPSSVILRLTESLGLLTLLRALT